MTCSGSAKLRHLLAEFINFKWSQQADARLSQCVSVGVAKDYPAKVTRLVFCCQMLKENILEAMKTYFLKYVKHSTYSLLCTHHQYTVYGIWCHMHNTVTYPILRRVLGYTNDQQLRALVSPHDTYVQVRLLVSGMIVFNSVMRCMPMLHSGLQVD